MIQYIYIYIYLSISIYVSIYTYIIDNTHIVLVVTQHNKPSPCFGSKALLEMAGGLGSLREAVKFDPEARVFCSESPALFGSEGNLKKWRVVPCGPPHSYSVL